MKRSLLTIALIICLISTVSAQTPKKMFNWYLQGGISIPQEDFGDMWKMGYHGTAKLGLGILPLIEPMGVVSYNFFPLDDGAFSEYDYTIDGYDVTTITYGVEAS